MIEIGIVDLSAEARRRLAGLVERWTWVNPESKQLSLPKLSLHPLSVEEVRFHGSLDVCLVGPELVTRDVAQVGALRRQLPGKILICILDPRSYSFGMVEQLGRLEVDDVLMDSASSDEFFRRLILLKRRVGSRARGRLIIVDAARGGVGVTFVAAGLGDSYARQGSSVCFVDCDTVSSDLSRSLQSRPFVNEPLKIILDQQRVVTAETVQECVFPVWADESGVVNMPPPAASDESVYSASQGGRTFLSVLEALKERYDFVIVDAAPASIRSRQAMHQIADEVVFVSNRDPAGAFANRHYLSLIAANVPHGNTLSAVINDVHGSGAPVSMLRESVLVAGDRELPLVVLPYSQRAGRWACSGRTPDFYLRRFFRELSNTSNCSNENRDATALRLTARIAEAFRCAIQKLKSIGTFSQEASPMIEKERLPLELPEPNFGGVEDEVVSKAVLS